MPKIAATILLSLPFVACQYSGNSFTTMTELEIIAYNEGLPLLEQVHCTTEADTSTFIRKRRCRTLEEIIRHNEKALMRLDVLHSGGNGSNRQSTIYRDGPR